jgi:hypothetical protein
MNNPKSFGKITFDIRQIIIPQLLCEDEVITRATGLSDERTVTHSPILIQTRRFFGFSESLESIELEDFTVALGLMDCDRMVVGADVVI